MGQYEIAMQTVMAPESMDFLLGLAGILCGVMFWKAILDAFLN